MIEFHKTSPEVVAMAQVYGEALAIRRWFQDGQVVGVVVATHPEVCGLSVWTGDGAMQWLKEVENAKVP